MGFEPMTLDLEGRCSGHTELLTLVKNRGKIEERSCFQVYSLTKYLSYLPPIIFRLQEYYISGYVLLYTREL